MTNLVRADSIIMIEFMIIVSFTCYCLKIKMGNLVSMSFSLRFHQAPTISVLSPLELWNLNISFFASTLLQTNSSSETIFLSIQFIHHTPQSSSPPPHSLCPLLSLLYLYFFLSLTHSLTHSNHFTCIMVFSSSTSSDK